MEKSKSFKWAAEMALEHWCNDLDIAHAQREIPEPTPIESLFYSCVMMSGVFDCFNGVVLLSQRNVEISNTLMVIDFAFYFEDKPLLFIELDGHDFHERTKEQAARDRKRDRLFASKGIKLFRFTGSEVWNNMGSIVSELDSVLFDLAFMANREKDLDNGKSTD